MPHWRPSRWISAALLFFLETDCDGRFLAFDTFRLLGLKVSAICFSSLPLDLGRTWAIATASLLAIVPAVQ